MKERAVLFALLAEARGLPNPELRERVGFGLEGRERRRLNDLKLVDSRKEGRAYVHELSDAGWRWCAGELSAGQRAGAGTMERTLQAVLAGLGRHLLASGQSLADIFKPASPGRAPGDVDVEALIVTWYRALAGEPGGFVKLSALRQLLTGVSRADTDAALERMYQAQRANLIPQSNQRALSSADRESALRIGGEHKHLISIEQR